MIPLATPTRFGAMTPQDRVALRQPPQGVNLIYPKAPRLIGTLPYTVVPDDNGRQLVFSNGNALTGNLIFPAFCGDTGFYCGVIRYAVNFGDSGPVNIVSTVPIDDGPTTLPLFHESFELFGDAGVLRTAYRQTGLVVASRQYLNASGLANTIALPAPLSLSGPLANYRFVCERLQFASAASPSINFLDSGGTALGFAGKSISTTTTGTPVAAALSVTDIALNQGTASQVDFTIEMRGPNHIVIESALGNNYRYITGMLASAPASIKISHASVNTVSIKSHFEAYR